MKIKNYETLREYKHKNYAVQIGVDDTDHMVFICESCKNPLEVISVESKKVSISMNGKERDNCTWIEVVCHKCKSFEIRKFYWKSEDGRYCWHRTYKFSEEEMKRVLQKIEDKVKAKKEKNV